MVERISCYTDLVGVQSFTSHKWNVGITATADRKPHDQPYRVPIESS